MGHSSVSASIQLVSLIILSGILSLETIKLGFCSDDHNVGCIDIERKALLKLKQGLTDLSGRLSSWVGEDCCKWSGVGCNNITGRVNRLNLHNRDWFDYYGPTEHGFDGEINPSLLVLKDLEYLDLSLNLFGGVQFPSFIGSLEKLKYLNLSRTYFVGVIPPNLGNLSRLLYLDLKSSGTLETDLQWLATLSSLKYLNLGGVNLTKTTSYWLPAVNMLPSLVELYLPHCSLPMLPLTLPSINFTSLSVLDLSGNEFTSTIPPWLFNLTKLEKLDFSVNSLTGKLPDSLGHLKSLRFLNLSYNSFQGSIPKSIGNLRFSYDSHVDLTSNRFEGPLPLWSSNISLLYLRDNLFSGPIPHNIGQVMPNLKYLDISTNSLSGSIPLFLGNLSQLQFILISNNLLSGEIPYFWNNMPSLVCINLSNNSLSGEIPHFWNNMPSLGCIDLSSNSLSGTIPRSLGSLTSLKFLILSSNNFSGIIPANIGNLELIETLDLSLNKLSGSIPQSMVSLTFLNHLNMSYNNLSGKIPTGNQFQTFVDPSIYTGNAGLSGCPLPIGCQDNEETPQVPSGDGGEDDDDSKLEKLPFVISMVIGFCAGFWGVFGTLAMKRSWRHAYFHFLDKVKDAVLDFFSAIGTYLQKRS
ncbi:probable LRR receptor-like serine/threonine-protein kinase At4g36180 isoform X3 [Prunus avium]|uniref:Probable LRR receptor-like serine/threonine-protein kinase At4g36180 isoform X3 n=1 Tax=Prunus avium TaxID=42229 RepID=A0A6P5RB97_PRUAV|nr:probable LRR receptor-like serine/threonine-protein kinase At4g36180 isoform X3 [Prunus avium]